MNFEARVFLEMGMTNSNRSELTGEDATPLARRL